MIGYSASPVVNNIVSSIVPYAVPTRSLAFDRSLSQVLSISNSLFGSVNTKKFTFTIWFKRTSTAETWADVAKFINPAGGSTPFPIQIGFSSTNNFDIIIRDAAGTVIARLFTTASFSNTVWHQLIVYWDSNNPTSNDRFQLYIDGVRITALNVNTQPSLGADMATPDSSTNFYIGGFYFYFNGKLCQPAYFDNAIVHPNLLYNGRKMLSYKDITGLKSLLTTNEIDSLTYDYALHNNWTNTNGVTKSTDIP